MIHQHHHVVEIYLVILMVICCDVTRFPSSLSNGPTGPLPPYPGGPAYGRGFLSHGCALHGLQPCGCMHRPIHHGEVQSPLHYFTKY